MYKEKEKNTLQIFRTYALVMRGTPADLRKFVRELNLLVDQYENVDVIYQKNSMYHLLIKEVLPKELI